MEIQLQLPGDWPVGVSRLGSKPSEGDDLEATLTWLQEAEVNYWIGNAPPSHITAAVHDPSGGPDIQRNFAPIEGQWPRGAIARWLVETARQHYPRLGP